MARPIRSNRPSLPQAGLSRRRFLGTAAGVGALSATGLLAGCGSDDGGDSASTPQTPDSDELTVANWPLYIDTARVDGEKVHPTLEAFEDKYDIEVEYLEPINDMSEFFAKIRPALSSGKATPYDLFILTDWMSAKVMQLDWVQKLDRANIPACRQRHRAAQVATVRPQPGLLHPVAVRRHGNRLRRVADRPGHEHRRPAHQPRPQGGGHGAERHA